RAGGPGTHLGGSGGRRRHPLGPRPGADGGDGGGPMSETVRTWQGPSAQERRRILRATRSVAIVGASANPARASYFVATYLLSSSRSEERRVGDGRVAGWT